MDKISKLNLFLKDLLLIKDLDIIQSESDRKRFSKDFFDYSPILREKLKDCLADIVVRPLSIESAVLVVRACKKYCIYLTIRGSGTGNYGQCVPIKGGVVMLLGALKKIRDFDPSTGDIVVESGCLLKDIDRYLSTKGRQLRLLPSTWRSASIGGFIAGGSGGIGSVRWGFLRDPGHLQGLEVILEKGNKDLIWLDAKSSEPLNHAYGTNGVITALKLSTRVAIDWEEIIVDCSSFRDAVKLLQKSVRSAIELNLATLLENEIVKYMPAKYESLDNNHRLLFLVAPEGVSTISRLASEFGGTFRVLGKEDLNSGKLLREITWNHTTLHMRSIDKQWTYLQMLLPEPEINMMELIKDRWGNDLFWHLEGVCQHGCQRIAALPIVKWRGANEMESLIAQCKDLGAVLFNPHVITVEDGGLGVIDGDQVAAKKEYDCSGILNPGKLKGWEIN